MKQLHSDSMIPLLGEIIDRLKVVEQIQADIAGLKSDMADVKSELVAIRELLLGHSSDLDNHERRIHRLERTLV